MGEGDVPAVDPAAERPWRSTAPKEAMLGQLEVLVAEAEALGPLLGAIPDEIIHGRPFEGAESIYEMLAGIARRDRTVRQQSLAAFLAEDAAELQGKERGSVPAGERGDVAETLMELGAARRQLISLARRVLDEAWGRRLVLGDDSISPLRYLGAVVQEDAAVLRQIAERVFESRPTGSPGLTRG